MVGEESGGDESGYQHDECWEIIEGLKDDEWVVVGSCGSGALSQSVGSKVEVERVPMPTEASYGVERLQ